MELRGKQIISGNGAGEGAAVIGFGRYMPSIMGFCVKAVYKIEIAAVGNVAPNRVLRARMLGQFDLIPAHLRDFEPAAISLQLAGQVKLDHMAWD